MPHLELLDPTVRDADPAEPRPRLPIGTLVLDKDRTERVVELIPAGVALPFTYRGTFCFAYENMTALRLELTAGPGTTRDEVLVIGKVELTALGPQPRGSLIEVVLEHHGGVIDVRLTAVEAGVTREASITW